VTLYKGKYRVESTRLLGWDYAWAGWYYVTICTYDKACFFGDVVDGSVILSVAGQIVAEEWNKTPQIRANIGLDAWVVMPNHLHGIIIINESVETSRRDVSTKDGLRSGSLGAVVGQFKSICTKRIRSAGYWDFRWQTRFYDHLIRDDEDLNRIREYIQNNPIQWAMDKLYSAR